MSTARLLHVLVLAIVTCFGTATKLLAQEQPEFRVSHVAVYETGHGVREVYRTFGIEAKPSDGGCKTTTYFYAPVLVPTKRGNDLAWVIQKKYDGKALLQLELQLFNNHYRDLAMESLGLLEADRSKVVMMPMPILSLRVMMWGNDKLPLGVLLQDEGVLIDNPSVTQSV
jgi:hypothetical protein